LLECSIVINFQIYKDAVIYWQNYCLNKCVEVIQCLFALSLSVECGKFNGGLCNVVIWLPIILPTE